AALVSIGLIVSWQAVSRDAGIIVVLDAGGHTASSLPVGMLLSGCVKVGVLESKRSSPSAPCTCTPSLWLPICSFRAQCHGMLPMRSSVPHYDSHLFPLANSVHLHALKAKAP